MSKHKMLLVEADAAADLGAVCMDEAHFRKLSEEAQRPRLAGVSLFHPPAPNGRDPQLPAAFIPNPSALKLALPNPSRVWESLSAIRLDAARLAGNGLFPNPSTEPAAAAFDMLRSRLLLVLAERGWRRIAITSPTHGCGKTLVAANLALSLARRPASRVVLMDLELRRPGLANLLGLRETAAIRDFLTGAQSLESHFLRVGTTLALALNGAPAADAAELLHSPDTSSALAAMMEQMDPEVVIIDMPPALVNDDVVALLPQVDAVLLVADGTRTTPEDIKACERMLEGRKPLLGVVLNRAQELTLGCNRHSRERG